MATSGLSRRQFLQRTSLAVPAALLGVRAGSLFAQAVAAPPVAVPALVLQARAAAATAKITTQTLRNNISVLMGSGGNIAVLPGREGKLLVDSGFQTSRPQLLEALAKLGPEPMTMLINTHWHFDHTDGNEWMHAAGATIVAQENTRKRMSTEQTIAAFHATFPPAPKGAVPTEVFENTRVLQRNAARIELAHFAPAHTDSDLAVHFVQANIVHVGDTWFNGFYPFIDYSTGGSIDGMIAATQRTLGKVGPETIIIPGHGPVGNKAGLSEYGEMLTGIRDKVAALKKQGKTLEETVAASPTAAYDGKWGKGMMNAGAFTGLVYAGV